MNVFDFVNSISHLKKTDLWTEASAKEYNAFVVNRALSYFPDTVILANEMNLNHHLDSKLQHDYLFNTIRPRKRFSKWAKAGKDENIELIEAFYGFSREKAKAALNVLTQEQIASIRQKSEKGGTK